MTLEEAKKAIDSFKADGLTDEEIAIVFHDMFVDDKLSIDELNELVGLVGYGLTDEFRNMSPEEQKQRLYDEIAEEGDEPEGGEPKGGEPESDEPKGDEPEDKEENGESEEEKARKLFGLNK